jgi:hypothetical protein
MRTCFSFIICHADEKQGMLCMILIQNFCENT